MWMTKIFNKKAQTILLSSTAIFLAFRYITNKPFGILIFSLMAYFIWPLFSHTDPMLPGELINWISNQPEGIGVGIWTSLLTIIGFLTAFSVANESWRAQRRTEIRLSAGNEIYDFFQEAMDNALEIELHAELLIESKQKILTNGGLTEQEASWLIIKTNDFEKARATLSKKSIKMHTLKSKYDLVLSQQIMAVSNIETAIANTDKISKIMWFESPSPFGDTAAFESAMKYSDHGAWEKSLSEMEDCRLNTLMACGAINGMMISDVIRPTISSLFSIKKLFSEINKNSHEFRIGLQKSEKTQALENGGEAESSEPNEIDIQDKELEISEQRANVK